jgi:hypothetical protein
MTKLQALIRALKWDKDGELAHPDRKLLEGGAIAADVEVISHPKHQRGPRLMRPIWDLNNKRWIVMDS